MRLNTVCNIEHWGDPGLRAAMRHLLPGFAAAWPDYPSGMEHRKHWEFAQLLVGLDTLGALRADATVLAVAAGRENVLFELTNRVRRVFATDIYGDGPFAEKEAEAAMLRDPDSVAPLPYDRRRLVVQYMDALDLRYEDQSFDVVYSLSSVEHFGGTDGVRRALAEQCRVATVGGVVALTTEVVVNGADPLDEGHLLLVSPDQLRAVCDSVDGLTVVEPIDFTVTDRTRQTVRSLADAVAASHRGEPDYPHIVLAHEGREFTSVSVFLRRTA